MGDLTKKKILITNRGRRRLAVFQPLCSARGNQLKSIYIQLAEQTYSTAPHHRPLAQTDVVAVLKPKHVGKLA